MSNKCLDILFTLYPFFVPNQTPSTSFYPCTSLCISQFQGPKITQFLNLSSHFILNLHVDLLPSTSHHKPFCHPLPRYTLHMSKAIQILIQSINLFFLTSTVLFAFFSITLSFNLILHLPHTLFISRASS